VAVVTGSFFMGAVPFSQIAARITRGVDLRTVGTGTVSGTALHEVAGFPALAAAGVCEVAKGAVGPLIARRIAGPDRPGLPAAAAAAAVCGHNWSPFLGGSGGRGISPAMGALLATAPIGAAVLGAGMGIGRLAGETALGSLVADVMVVPLAGAVHRRAGALAAAAVLSPMIAKRVVGNGPLDAIPGTARRTLLNRLLYDRDER
jgi:glycerol-3-phosphate acyltransferase PlsY